MSITEALECSKIFIPFVSVLREAGSGLDLVARIFQVMSGENALGLMRAVALMEHRGVEEVVMEYKAAGVDVLLAAIANLFRVNPLPDLIETAALFGLTDERWTHA
jgi:hypothetical protein